jgi:hypothetical protein
LQTTKVMLDRIEDRERQKDESVFREIQDPTSV